MATFDQAKRAMDEANTPTRARAALELIVAFLHSGQGTEPERLHLQSEWERLTKLARIPEERTFEEVKRATESAETPEEARAALWMIRDFLELGRATEEQREYLRSRDESLRKLSLGPGGGKLHPQVRFTEEPSPRKGSGPFAQVGGSEHLPVTFEEARRAMDEADTPAQASAALKVVREYLRSGRATEAEEIYLLSGGEGLRMLASIPDAERRK
jgi:hypothetical protein